MSKFKRATKGASSTVDEQGKIQVKIFKLTPGHNSKPHKGNMQKSFTLVEAKVGDVFAAIEKALFE